MILHSPHSLLNLQQFGIEIPMLDERVERIYQHALKKNYPHSICDDSWPTLTKEDLLFVHELSYVEKILGTKEDQEKILFDCYELKNSDGTFNRFDPSRSKRELTELVKINFSHVEGTLKASELCMDKGLCFFLGGGFHHAMSFRANGFCLINDVAMAAKKHLIKNPQGLVWIIDVDAHKGDGTAQICRQEEYIKTLSIHMAKSWPLDNPMQDVDGKLNPSFIASDIDVPIEINEEHLYLKKLDEALLKLPTLSNRKPTLAIVVLGADPYVHDALPSTTHLELELKELLTRDKMIYQFLSQKNIPTTYVIAGGYGDQVYQVYTQFLDFIYS